MSQTNQQRMRDFFRDVAAGGDIAAADDYMDTAAVDPAPWPGHPANRDGFKAGLSEMRTSFPDLAITVERMITEDDLVVAHTTMSGTYLGEFMGIAGSGKTFNVEAIDILRMRGGKIAEHWGVIDEAGMAEQLGLAP